MIERKFVAEKLREVLVKKYFSKILGKGKYSNIEIKKTPLGEKIVVYTTRPGLVVGRKGENIKLLTAELKKRFKMENPQIEVSEIKDPDLDAQTVVEQIVSTFERFGPKRFKSIGYRALQRIMDAGALGAEISISGRGVPSSRAKTWKFYAGYLKKCGDVSVSQVLKAQSVANLKSGTIGIKVSILLPDAILPDKIKVIKPEKITVEAVVEKEEDTEEDSGKKKTVKKKTVKKKATKKKVAKKKEEKPAEGDKVEEEPVAEEKKKTVKKKVAKKKASKKEETTSKEEKKTEEPAKEENTVPEKEPKAEEKPKDAEKPAEETKGAEE